VQLPARPPVQQTPPAAPPVSSSPPEAAAAAPTSYHKPKRDDDGFIQINPRTALLVVGGLIALVAVTVVTMAIQQGAKNSAAELKRGIIPEEREFAKQVAIERVRFYLGEKREPLFNDPRWEFIDSRGKYYKIQGKVRASLGKEERWVHNYWVELRLDPSVPEGYVLHSVYVGGRSLYSNPYIERRR
jgi:hypothetical protein